MNNFKKALEFTLRWEGFISNDVKDPGSLTIWGISYRYHKEAVIKMEELINTQKKDEAFAIAEKIYYENYWLKSGCDKLPEPMDVCVFDSAVNCGVSRAKEFYNISTDWQNYLCKRLDFYTGLENFKYFGRGWTKRVVSLYYFVKAADENV